MSKKILLNAIAAIVILVIGIFIGTKLPRKIATATGSAANTYQAGWDAAKAKLAQSPVGQQLAGSSKNVSGIVQSISGSELTIKINQTDPLADPSLDTRTITVDSNTKLSMNVQKDPAEFQQEMQAFQSSMKNQTAQPSATQAPVVPPMPFDKKDISLSDLKVGEQISVSAGSDISSQAAFTATEIDAQSAAAPVTAPAPTTTAPAVAPTPSPATPAATTTSAATTTPAAPSTK